MLENRIPVVTTIHALDSPPDKKDRAWMHSLISRCYRVIAGIIKIYQLSCVFKHSDRVIIVSEKTKKDISVTCPGINMNHSEVLSPGIDLSRFKKQDKSIAKKKLGYTNRFVLLYVGRMICGKRPTDILDALISVLPEITNAMAVFIGVGPELAVIEKKTRELKLQEHVMYISGVKNSDLPLYYSAADIFINPTDEDETFGISTGEAMACGTPVLISAKGARTGVVPWDEVCVYSNIDDLTRKISLLYGNASIRDDLSRRGLSFVMRFSFVHTEQRINEIYKEMLSRRRRKKRFVIPKLTVFILMDIFRDIIERLARLRFTK
jgi:1,2-diacylglycerol 3-alpha-glucosyltransferase